MTVEFKDLTLAEVVTAMPAAASVFERRHIDYCCRGGRTLAEGCREAGLDADGVIAEIIESANRSAGDRPERDWSLASMTELADHIEQSHHVTARRILEELASLAPRVAAAHAGRHPELAEVRDRLPGFIEEMYDHFIREERVLFPWLRRLDRPRSLHKGPPWSVRRPIDCMEHDHDSAGETLGHFRALTHGYAPPADACPSYRRMLELLELLEADTHVHIHKENNILFPFGVLAEERLRERAGSNAVPAQTDP